MLINISVKLKRDIMLESLRSLLSDVKQFEFENDIYFVGGTALEDRINHRTPRTIFVEVKKIGR